MWFEILPCYMIMVSCMYSTQIIPGIMNYLAFGNMYHRSLDSEHLMLQYLRDVRLTKSVWKLAGLENIPDDGENDKCDDE